MKPFITGLIFGPFLLLLVLFAVCSADAPKMQPVGLIPADNIMATSFSPDGKLLIGATAKGNIIAWNTLTADKQFQLEGHTEAAPIMRFSSDSSLLASGGGIKDAAVKVWDCTTGKLITTLPFTFRVTALCFSPDKKSLVVATDIKQVGLWNIADGTLTSQTNDLTLPVTGIYWPEDSETFSVVGGGLGKELKVLGDGDLGAFHWSFSTAALYAEIESKTFVINTLTEIPTGNPNAAFSPDGQRIVFIGEYADVTRFHDGKNKTTIDWTSGHPRIWVTPHSDEEMVNTFTPESRADQFLTIYNSGIPSTAWSPNGKLIALPAETMMMWDGKGKVVRLDIAQGADGFLVAGEFKSAAFSPDGKFLAGACKQGIHIWKVP